MLSNELRNAFLERVGLTQSENFRQQPWKEPILWRFQRACRTGSDICEEQSCQFRQQCTGSFNKAQWRVEKTSKKDWFVEIALKQSEPIVLKSYGILDTISTDRIFIIHREVSFTSFLPGNDEYYETSCLTSRRLRKAANKYTVLKNKLVFVLVGTQSYIADEYEGDQKMSHTDKKEKPIYSVQWIRYAVNANTVTRPKLCSTPFFGSTDNSRSVAVVSHFEPGGLTIGKRGNLEKTKNRRYEGRKDRN